MAIPLLGSQSLFVRLGHIEGGRNQLDTARGATLGSRVTTIFADYVSTDQQVVQDIFVQRDENRTANDPLATYYQALSQSTVVTMANASSPLPSVDLPSAIVALQQQMISVGSGLQKPTVGSSVAVGSSNYGDAKLITSTTAPNGRQLDYMFAEAITCVVTNDAGLGATIYSEPVQYLGAPSVPASNWNWPQGSGANAIANIVNGDGDTLLANGGFETWPTPTVLMATSWEIVTGTINVDIIRNGTVGIPLGGDFCCEFNGDGSAQLAIKQQLTNLLPSTSYAVMVWMKGSNAIADGGITFSLIDQDDTVINDGMGTPNITSEYTLVANTWVGNGVYFRTPATLPEQVFLLIETTDPIDNSSSGYVDKCAIVAGNQLYAGGIFANIFSGGTPSQIGDLYTITNTTTGTVTTFVRSLDRDWGLRELGLFLPSATTAYIPDALIT